MLGSNGSCTANKIVDVYIDSEVALDTELDLNYLNAGAGVSFWSGSKQVS